MIPLAQIHPAIVHFPIVLLFLTPFFAWADRIWPNRGLDRVAWYMLRVGLVAAILAIATGFLAVYAAHPEGEALQAAEIHRDVALITTAVFLVVLAVRNPRARTVLQIVGIVLIVTLGFLGHRLTIVYGIGHSHEHIENQAPDQHSERYLPSLAWIDDEAQSAPA
jgi:uncharacterized membrane protein